MDKPTPNEVACFVLSNIRYEFLRDDFKEELEKWCRSKQHTRPFILVHGNTSTIFDQDSKQWHFIKDKLGAAASVVGWLSLIDNFTQISKVRLQEMAGPTDVVCNCVCSVIFDSKKELLLVYPGGVYISWCLSAYIVGLCGAGFTVIEERLEKQGLPCKNFSMALLAAWHAKGFEYMKIYKSVSTLIYNYAIIKGTQIK